MIFRSNTLKSFQRALGRHKVLLAEEDLLTYSYDTTGERVIPQIVVLAESTEDVVMTVDFAIENGMKITPRGAGTGMSGGSVPLKRGVVLCTERMNFIHMLDVQEKTILVGPGITTAEVQEAAAKHGLFYPPDPSSHRVSTIGGNIAENAGGLRCAKYGVTKHYVLGLEFVSTRAEVMQTGLLSPNLSDYDLTALLVGSEGTLGIITSALLRLIDAPETQGTMRIFFSALEAAGSSAAAIMAAGIVPSVCELMDRSVLTAVSEYTGIRLPNGAEALLLIEIDGNAEEVSSGMAQVENICRNRRAIQVRATQDRTAAERLWRLRRSVSPSLARLAMGKMNEDVAVPRSRLPELIQVVQRLSKRYGLDMPCYGHAGDGNLHVNVMYNPEDLLQLKRARQVVEEVFKETIALGGTISGEHGIGSVKRDFMRLQMSNAEIDVLRHIKHSFDSEGLFNPGKVIPD